MAETESYGNLDIGDTGNPNMDLVPDRSVVVEHHVLRFQDTGC